MRILTLLAVIFFVLGSVTACETSDSNLQQTSSTIFLQPWNSGINADEPAFHVQQIDSNTLVLRQSLRTTFEAPFLYLIFGDEKALLIDTGVKNASLRGEVDRLIDDWLTKNNRDTLSLIVMHSHGHGDHVGNDADFAARPNTVVVGHTATDVAAFSVWMIGRMYLPHFS